MPCIRGSVSVLVYDRTKFEWLPKPLKIQCPSDGEYPSKSLLLHHLAVDSMQTEPCIPSEGAIRAGAIVSVSSS
jgi:hypothetical protein